MLGQILPAIMGEVKPPALEGEENEDVFDFKVLFDLGVNNSNDQN